MRDRAVECMNGRLCRKCKIGRRKCDGEVGKITAELVKKMGSDRTYSVLADRWLMGRVNIASLYLGIGVDVLLRSILVEIIEHRRGSRRKSL